MFFKKNLNKIVSSILSVVLVGSVAATSFASSSTVVSTSTTSVVNLQNSEVQKQIATESEKLQKYIRVQNGKAVFKTNDYKKMGYNKAEFELMKKGLEASSKVKVVDQSSVTQTPNGPQSITTWQSKNAVYITLTAQDRKNLRIAMYATAVVAGVLAVVATSASGGTVTILGVFMVRATSSSIIAAVLGGLAAIMGELENGKNITITIGKSVFKYRGGYVSATNGTKSKMYLI